MKGENFLLGKFPAAMLSYCWEILHVDLLSSGDTFLSLSLQYRNWNILLFCDPLGSPEISKDALHR